MIRMMSQHPNRMIPDTFIWPFLLFGVDDMTRTRIDTFLWILTFVGAALMFAGGEIFHYGRRQAGLQPGTRPYRCKGGYYWQWRGNLPVEEEEKRMTRQQYDTFFHYRALSTYFFTVGGVLGLGAGTPAMIRLIIRKSRM